MLSTGVLCEQIKVTEITASGKFIQPYLLFSILSSFCTYSKCCKHLVDSDAPTS